MYLFLMELWSTEKPYTVPFKEISLCSSLVKSFDSLPKQKLYQLMLLLALNFQISCFMCIQVTLITIVTQAKFCICFTKVNTIFFTVASVLSFIPRVVPSPEFFDYQYEIMKYYQHQNYNISSRVIIQTPATLSIKCYFLTITRKFTFDCVSC